MMDECTDGQKSRWMMVGWMDGWMLDSVRVLTLSSLKDPMTEPGWEQRKCLLMGRPLTLTHPTLSVQILCL